MTADTIQPRHRPVTIDLDGTDHMPAYARDARYLAATTRLQERMGLAVSLQPADAVLPEVLGSVVVQGSATWGLRVWEV